MATQPLPPETRREFFDAIHSLDIKQELTLYNFSSKLLEGTQYGSGVDLLHEVIIRVLDGSRGWRRDISIGSFLHESMRSVASVDTRHPQRRPLCYEDWMEVGLASTRENDNEFACSPEELLIQRQEEEIRREVLGGAKERLARDQDAMAVLQGLAREMTPAEIRKAFGITEPDYKAARARIANDLRAHGHGPRRCPPSSVAKQGDTGDANRREENI